MAPAEPGGPTGPVGPVIDIPAGPVGPVIDIHRPHWSSRSSGAYGTCADCGVRIRSRSCGTCRASRSCDAHRACEENWVWGYSGGSVGYISLFLIWDRPDKPLGITGSCNTFI